MRTASYQTFDKDEILDKIFSFLVTSGLENVSIRELCRGTGLVQGTLYYWFADKESIIIEATEYGLKRVTDDIFRYVFASVGHLDYFFSGCLDLVDKYRRELRFIYQMAASPVYCEKIKCDGKYFFESYDKYAERLAKLLSCDSKKIKTLVRLFASAICNYAIWDDREATQSEIDFIAELLRSEIRATA